MPKYNTTPEGILQIAAQGESKNVEFKLRLPPADVVARVIAAFANSDGGILLLGLKDDRDIVGLSDQEVGIAMERLQKIGTSLLPYPIELGVVDVKGKRVVYAIVDPTPKHHYPVVSSRGEVFKRQDDRIIVIPASALKGSLRKVAQELRVTHKEIKVFVAMSFRDEEDPALVDYYRAMERAVAVTQLPIVLRRIDLVEGDYEISQQLMDEIDNSDIVIADFTLNARNVYFELGYARGRGRRIIQTARKETNLEFDIRNWRTLFYRNATELEERLVAELKVAYEEVVVTPNQKQK